MKPMITNETRAKLIGNTAKMYADDALSFWCVDATHARGGYWCGKPPSYDTDANAVAELRAFVRARGEEAEFTNALADAVEGGRFPYTDVFNVADAFILLDATPQQQTAAFDATFKTELERINDKQS